MINRTINLPEDFKKIKNVKYLDLGNLVLTNYISDTDNLRQNVKFSQNAMIILLKGSKIIHSNKEDFHLHYGKGLFLNKGEHTLSDITTHNAEYQSLIFSFSDSMLLKFVKKYDFIEPLLKNIKPNKEIFDIEIEPIFRAILDSFLPMFEYNQSYSTKILELKFEEIFLILLESKSSQNSFLAFLKSIVESTYMDLKILFSYYDSSFSSVQDMSAFAKMDMATFSKKFKQSFSISPKNWLDERRFERAVFLLKFSDKNINQICQSVGFNSQSWFCERFKERYSSTPKEFQKSNNLYFLQ